MSRILFIHGWSFDASVWHAVKNALPGHPCHALDLGYFTAPDLRVPEGTQCVVGHSFGVLWAMMQPSLEGLPLLAINGFTRFSAAPDFPHGTPERVLRRMIQRMQEAPGEVLRSFRLRCGAPEPPSTFCRERLEEDLERLLGWDARPLETRKPLAALASQDDPLLAMPMTEQMFPGTLRTLPSGGHVLPLSAPEAVARFIAEHLP